MTHENWLMMLRKVVECLGVLVDEKPEKDKKDGSQEGAFEGAHGLLRLVVFVEVRSLQLQQVSVEGVLPGSHKVVGVARVVARRADEELGPGSEVVDKHQHFQRDLVNV